MARRISPAQLRSQLRQIQSKLKQAGQKQKQAVDRYNREARARNQKQKRAVDDYNRAARAHNSKIAQELARLRSGSSTRTQRVSVSAQSVHSAFAQVEQRREMGTPYPDGLFSLFEDETANSLRAANAIDRGDAAEAEEVSALQATTLTGELEAFSPDLAQRWAGALFALNPRNSDAARHFCTSARECIEKALDIAAPDDVVKRELSNCIYLTDGRLARRSKLKYLLVEKGILDDAAEAFVNEDVDDILGLFRIFNDGTHGEAGRFDLNELVAVKQRAESGIRFIYELAH